MTSVDRIGLILANGFLPRRGGPGWRFVELTLPRSVRTLPLPGCFNDPSHPLPKREGPLSFALNLPIFSGEPVAKAAGLQPTPRRVAPQTAPPGPGSIGTGACGQPGAMVWPLRTNYAIRWEMGQMTGSRNGQLRTPSPNTDHLAVAELEGDWFLKMGSG